MAKSEPTERYVDWGKLRKQWESDPTLSFAKMSLALGGFPTGQAIGQRKKREGWTRADVATPKGRKAVAKAADKLTAKNPPKMEVLPPEEPVAPPGEPSPGAIDAAVMARAEIVDRQRREWQIPRNRLYAAAQDTGPDRFGKMKEAKIMSEALLNIHKGERIAWGLDGDSTLTVRHIIPPSKRDVYD